MADANWKTDRYLSQLALGLHPLPQDERDAILREIESHLLESPAALTLESPDLLAKRFLDDYRLAGALARPSPAALLATVLERATRSVLALSIGILAVVCYALSVASAIVAVLKPIVPEKVGLWFDANGFKALGFVSDAARDGVADRLGYAIIPLGVIAAVFLYVGGTWLLRSGAGVLLIRSRSEIQRPEKELRQ